MPVEAARSLINCQRLLIGTRSILRLADAFSAASKLESSRLPIERALYTMRFGCIGEGASNCISVALQFIFPTQIYSRLKDSFSKSIRLQRLL
jgi:hypothetical protein